MLCFTNSTRILFRKIKIQIFSLTDVIILFINNFLDIYKLDSHNIIHNHNTIIFYFEFLRYIRVDRRSLKSSD